MAGLFKDILASNETLFKDESALSYEFMPKLIPFREQQQRYIASCIKPLLQGRRGKNLFIYGQPGVGKTVACKHIFNELEEETEQTIAVYVNCWQKNTTHRIILEICNVLGYTLTHNKKTEELVSIINDMLDGKSAVFAFDEIDKVTDFDFLYTLLEEIQLKSILLITNYKFWLDELEERIKSRLTTELLEFKPYSYSETEGILKQRLDYAFFPNVWNDSAFGLIVEKTSRLQDIRLGLYLMKEAGSVAEGLSSKLILPEHAKKAVDKIDGFSIKKSEGLSADEALVMDTIRKNAGKRAGDLFKLYQNNNGASTYKTFQRRIDKLHSDRFIVIEKTGGGKGGNTTIINPADVAKLIV